MSADEIERIETEEIDPPMGAIARIAEAAGFPLVELFALPPAPIDCTVRLSTSPGEAWPDIGAHLPVPLVSGDVAGGNARIVDENILGWLFLPKREFGHRSGNLVAVRISGRSMEPEIPDGAIVAVDRTDRVLTPQGIYALRDPDGGCTVKRIRLLDPSHVALIPSNRSEFEIEFWKLAPGEVIEDRLIGRVVWLGYNLLEADKAAESPPPWGKEKGSGRNLPPPRTGEDEPF